MDKIIIESKTIKKRFVIKKKSENDMSFGNAIFYNFIKLKYKSLVADAGSVDFDPLKMLVVIDLPILLPLKHKKRFDLNLSGKKFKIYHHVKTSGEENYSTFDTTLIPKFTSLRILCDAEIFDAEEKEDNYKQYKITRIIYKVIERFIQILNISLDTPIGFNIDILNYEIHYYEREKSIFRDHPVFSVFVCYDGIITIKGERSNLDISKIKEIQTNLMSEKLKIVNFAEEEKIEKYIGIYQNNLLDEDFISYIDVLINKFLFYCSQNPRTISKFEEEEIRDLFLVLANCVNGYANGEVYNYDGKLDFKITNPRNDYEYIAGEFKKWKGISSFEEMYLQGTEKHSTGNEAKIYLILVSKNKNLKSVEETITEFLCKKNKIGISDIKSIEERGSKLYFKEIALDTRKGTLPLAIGICDVFYEKVKV